MQPRVAEAESRSLQRWQAHLLPFMTSMIAALAAFFFLASLGQLAYLQWHISRQPETPLDAVAILQDLPDGAGVQERLAVAQFRASLALEREALARRYRQGSVALMSRLWTTYLGFVTGMILALVGAAFVLGKLRDSPSELRVEAPAGKASLASASPGIILAGLGALLMGIAITTHHPIETVDSPLYLRGAAAQSAPAVPPRLGNPYGNSEEPR